MATRGHGARRECPVRVVSVRCGATVRAGDLMCPDHWSKVPKPVKADVWATWKAWHETGGIDEWDAYAVAREAALAAVEPYAV